MPALTKSRVGSSLGTSEELSTMVETNDLTILGDTSQVKFKQQIYINAFRKAGLGLFSSQLQRFLARLCYWRDKYNQLEYI